MSDWHKTPEQVFGDRLREARKRKDWTQEQLAARLSQLGYPLSQTMISKLEKGRAKLTALRNLFALAVALDVSPLNLIVPLEDDEDVPLEVINGIRVPAPVARAWIRGLWGLPPVGKFDGTDMETFLAESAVSDLRARVRQALQSKTRQPTIAGMLSGLADPDPALVDGIVQWIRREQRVEEGDDDG
jgi:transcriptional regulator with XRE-family HTH domain